MLALIVIVAFSSLGGYKQDMAQRSSVPALSSHEKQTTTFARSSQNGG